MKDWTQTEVEATVADYFAMLEAELRGEPYNKAEHNRRLQQLTGRSKSAIENKHQNISAILAELGCYYVDGYKPLTHYQDALREPIVGYLNASPRLLDLLRQLADAPVERAPEIRDLESLLVEPPRGRTKLFGKRGDEEIREARGAQPAVDYAQLEQRNRSLGAAGEQLVLRYEHQRLWTAGKKHLAERIEHVSKTRGDHLGYDVHSFEATGANRLIEVKTTRRGILQPFYVSRNEVRVSKEQDEAYHLYRVHRFDKDTKFFILNGALPDVCTLEGVTFEARVK